VWDWVQGEAHDWLEIQIIFRNSRRRTEVEMLKKGGEELEELHPGQTLSNTNPAA